MPEILSTIYLGSIQFASKLNMHGYNMKKRILSLYVENNIGVLAKIAGMFSGKRYNLDSLSVGTTEDETISRLTIHLSGDDATFEQIKKQLNRSIEVIKVIDLTEKEITSKELLFIKVRNCHEEDRERLLEIFSFFQVNIISDHSDELLLEQMAEEKENSDLIKQIIAFHKNIEVVRGGSIAIEK